VSTALSSVDMLMLVKGEGEGEGEGYKIAAGCTDLTNVARINYVQMVSDNLL
jgi:hypothetical protein